MQAAEVKSLLEEKLPNTQVEVEGEGCNFQLNLISDELAALSPVKRSQMALAPLSHLIADGTIHAVTPKFFSRADWAARS
ncbi:BolA family protein [Ectopseudomonas mendocina]|jgi:acid stress-induced BolA-like protein IbaG/YrbA|uniref:BolA family transcriptional regulator n=1 Tax=Ectopseudomonas mendocina TaxID=300 RepID=A0A2R3QWV0_ECTME|nr:BolA family protein [Pseudomonas mendocina]AVO56226.1 BolA family transcriptional regulator [Pseudomonas mendocina]